MSLSFFRPLQQVGSHSRTEDSRMAPRGVPRLAPGAGSSGFAVGWNQSERKHVELTTADRSDLRNFVRNSSEAGGVIPSAYLPTLRIGEYIFQTQSEMLFLRFSNTEMHCWINVRRVRSWS